MSFDDSVTANRNHSNESEGTFFVTAHNRKKMKVQRQRLTERARIITETLCQRNALLLFFRNDQKTSLYEVQPQRVVQPNLPLKSYIALLVWYQRKVTGIDNWLFEFSPGRTVNLSSSVDLVATATKSTAIDATH